MKRLILLPVLLVAACSSPDADYKVGCVAMAKETDDMTKPEQKSFCTCLTEESDALDGKAKKTLGRLMKSYDQDNSLDDLLEEAVDKGTLKSADAEAYFSVLKSCSMKIAM